MKTETFINYAHAIITALLLGCGYSRVAGGYMLGVLVVRLVYQFWRSWGYEQSLQAKGTALDRLGEMFGVPRLIGENDAAYRRRIMRETRKIGALA